MALVLQGNTDQRPNWLCIMLAAEEIAELLELTAIGDEVLEVGGLVAASEDVMRMATGDELA